jgi:hypothetical protein
VSIVIDQPEQDRTICDHDGDYGDMPWVSERHVRELSWDDVVELFPDARWCYLAVPGALAALIAEREAAARQQGRIEGLREAAGRLYAEADKSCLKHATELASIASAELAWRDSEIDRLRQELKNEAQDCDIEQTMRLSADAELARLRALIGPGEIVAGFRIDGWVGAEDESGDACLLDVEGSCIISSSVAAESEAKALRDVEPQPVSVGIVVLRGGSND